jgi:ABC-type molybdenum transport system ATPase subunit/photorepair protein PhrA
MSNLVDENNIIVEFLNCNNIESSKLVIKPSELNIRYALNGTGKSTIAKALQKYSKKEDLSSLMPFGSKASPEVKVNKKLNEILVFDEAFINNTVFKESEVIDNAFEIFIKSDEYDRKVDSLNAKMRSIRFDVEENSHFLPLLNTLNQFAQKIKLNSNGSVKNDAIFKSLTNHENIYRVPAELSIFKPFLQNKELNIDWIDWKTKGEKYDTVSGCPYCAKELAGDYDKQKEVFKKSFQKASTKNLKDVLDIVESFDGYLIKDKYDLLIKCIKDEVDEATITQEITKLRVEAQGIIDKVGYMLLLNKLEIKRDQIGQIEQLLKNAHIQLDSMDYFYSELSISIFNDINNRLIEIEKITTDLKKEIGEFVGFVLGSIMNAKRDINNFLQSSGINYELEIEQIDSSTVKTILKYKSRDKSTIEVDQIREHLSWGEKNAFSLILFMHYAISRNPDLIILDDPISSFDENKKYAIINRMFSKHYGSKTLLNRTVLMLSHDFEPVIDFVVNKKPTGGSVNAEHLWNRNGKLLTTTILDKDIVSWISLIRRYAQDDSLCEINRLAFLRKYIELENDNDAMGLAYNIISSIQHGDEKPTVKISEEKIVLMKEEQYIRGKTFLDNYFQDFDYREMLKKIRNIEFLKSSYVEQSNNYLKLQIFRTYLDLSDRRCQIKDESLIKFIDETYHIENDYIYYFDLLKYEVIPDFIIKECDSFILA